MILMIAGIIVFTIIITIVITLTEYRKQKYENSQYYREKGTSFYEMIGNKGGIGEYRTSEILSQFIPNGRMILNAYIPSYRGYSEIDIIFITIYGIYVIENKNYSGWIFGNETDQNWTETYPNGQKFRFYNPVKQNETHVKYLKALLEKANMPYGRINSIVCFNDNATLKRIYSSVPVTNTRNICSYINTSQILLSGSQVEQLYIFLKQYTHITQVQQQQHIYDARQYKHPYLKRIK